MRDAPAETTRSLGAFAYYVALVSVILAGELIGWYLFIRR
jgi:hypothetical protein